jgi:hypothetical protein
MLKTRYIGKARRVALSSSSLGKFDHRQIGRDQKMTFCRHQNRQQSSTIEGVFKVGSRRRPSPQQRAGAIGCSKDTFRNLSRAS